MNTVINYKFDRPLHYEDAPAVSNDKYLIVCDGLGAGGQNKHTINGETHTSAYYGSRLLSQICSDYYDENYDAILESLKDKEALSHIVDGLKVTIKKQLDEFVDEHKLVKTIKGKSIKLLPSTLSSMLFKVNNDSVDVVVISAGDTRAFILTPQNGLQQLSKDDVDEDVDAFEKATIVNNNICQDRDFSLNFRCYTVKMPCILFVCSDGCYDYFSSPMEVEYLIDAAFNAWFTTESAKSGAFGEKLGDFISSRSKLQDDCSMAGAVIGCQDDKSFRKGLYTRAKEIETKYIRTFDSIDKEAKKIDGKYDPELKELKQNMYSCDKQIASDLLTRVKNLINKYLFDKPIADSETDILNFILSDESFKDFLKQLSDAEEKRDENKKKKQKEKDEVYDRLRIEFSKAFTAMNQSNNIYSSRSRLPIPLLYSYNPANDLFSEEQKYQRILNAYLQCLNDLDAQFEYIKNATPQQIADTKAHLEFSRRYQRFWNQINNLVNSENRLRSLRPQVVAEPEIVDERTIDDAFTDAWKSSFSQYRRIPQYQESCRLFDQCVELIAAVESIEPFSDKDRLKLFENYYQNNGQDLVNRIRETFGIKRVCEPELYDKLIGLQRKYKELEEESSKYVKQKYSLWLEYKVNYELFEKSLCDGVR